MGLFSIFTVTNYIKMLTHSHPKLPMRNKAVTKEFYCIKLGFEVFGSDTFEDYLMLQKDQIQLHFFEFPSLNPLENYGQVYIRTEKIEAVFDHFIRNNLTIHPAGHLQTKPWGQKEFSLLDPDHNLLTFGETID
ncbi:MAG: hypothetical protein RLZZ44_412 [Bacteroidota bacterium]